MPFVQRESSMTKRRSSLATWAIGKSWGCASTKARSRKVTRDRLSSQAMCSTTRAPQWWQSMRRIGTSSQTRRSNQSRSRTCRRRHSWIRTHASRQQPQRAGVSGSSVSFRTSEPSGCSLNDSLQCPSQKIRPRIAFDLAVVWTIDLFGDYQSTTSEPPQPLPQPISF